MRWNRSMGLLEGFVRRRRGSSRLAFGQLRSTTRCASRRDFSMSDTWFSRRTSQLPLDPSSIGCAQLLTPHPPASSFTGPGALAFLSTILPASLASLPVPKNATDPYGSSLSVLLTPEGGIIDDCMITRWGAESCVPDAFCPVCLMLLTFRPIFSKKKTGSTSSRTPAAPSATWLGSS